HFVRDPFAVPRQLPIPSHLPRLVNHPTAACRNVEQLKTGYRAVHSMNNARSIRRDTECLIPRTEVSRNASGLRCRNNEKVPILPFVKKGSPVFHPANLSEVTFRGELHHLFRWSSRNGHDGKNLG